MAVDREQLHLLTEGTQDVNRHWITDMGLEQRSRWCLPGLHASKDLRNITTLFHPPCSRFRSVVHRRNTGYLLNVGHEADTDDVILVLEHQGEVPVILPVLVP